MKKIIFVLAIAVIGMASFAQKITVYNELYSEVIEKPALKNATTKFWGVRDRLYGKVESDRWAVEARFGVKFGDYEASYLGGLITVTEDYVLADNGLKANVWLKPFDFLTIAAGTELDYALSPVYMVARDKNMDSDDGKWADRSIAVAVTPIENLLVGAAIPLPTDINDQFQLQLGAQYRLFDAFNIAAKYYGIFGKPEYNRQNDIGIYADYTGFENLRIAAGYTGHFRNDTDENHTLIDIAADYKWNSFLFAADATVVFAKFDKILGGNNFVPFTLALYGGFEMHESRLNLYARVILSWNLIITGSDVAKANPGDGALSLRIHPGVKFTLNEHHSFGAEVSMGFCKPSKNADTGFGISFPIYWKYTF